MAPKLITMLTNNDETVGDAEDVFRACADLPCSCWGFKDVGLPLPRMKDLVATMKSAGKTTFLEVVTLAEGDGLAGARLAIDCGFDYLMGTVYYPSIGALFASSATKYFPFCGKVSGHPSILEGSPAAIAADAARLVAAGAAGVDVLAYRNKADPELVAAAVVRALKAPVVVAGSIDSFARVDAMKRLDPWGFTIGTALFQGRFGPDESFRGQLAAVLAHLSK